MIDIKVSEFIAAIFCLHFLNVFFCQITVIFIVVYVLCFHPILLKGVKLR